MAATGRISNEAIADSRKKEVVGIAGVMFFGILLFFSYATIKLLTAVLIYICIVLWGAFFLAMGILIHHIVPDLFNELELKVIWFQEAIFSPPFFTCVRPRRTQVKR